MDFILQNSFGYLLNVAAMRISRIFSQKLKQYDLTPYQFGTLVCLAEQEGLTQKELSTKTYDDEATTKRVVDRLIEKNLVVRLNSQYDKRAYQLYLTENAKNLLPVLINEANKINCFFAKNLADGDYARSKEIFRQIQNLEYKE